MSYVEQRDLYVALEKSEVDVSEDYVCFRFDEFASQYPFYMWGEETVREWTDTNQERIEDIVVEVAEGERIPWHMV